VKVRIVRTPDEDELDGVRLDDMMPGSVREVSSSIGTWLVAQRYAEPEMRVATRAHEEDFLVRRDIAVDRRDTASDRASRHPRRRSTER
jgi:hypothetical protein